MAKKPPAEPITSIGSTKALRLFVNEWCDASGDSDERIAGRVQYDDHDGVSRETVWRWRKEPWRLDVKKLNALANALGIKAEDFYHHPARPSVDALLRDQPDDEVVRIADAVRALIRKAS